MPGIKKKWIKASHQDDEESERPSEEEQAAPTEVQKGGMLKGLDGEVLLEKRKRFVPTAEIKLTEWLDSNLEKRSEESLPVHQLYGYYTDLCQGQNWDVLDLPDFKKMIKTKFGKSFGLTESSVLKGLVKERKLNKEKKTRCHGIRMKDVIHEAINHYGNPAKGVRFWSLKQFIGTRYPALQVDSKPKMLKRSIEMGVQYGQLELVKGIGMAGFYKLPGAAEPDPKESKTEEKSEKSEDKESEKEVEDGEQTTESPKKNQEGSSEDKENKEQPEEEKKKQKKPVKYKPVEYSSLCHENPDKLEDAFPLAITYQSAPKVAGLSKIRKYIATKYNEEVTDNRWRQVIEKGVQNGSWEHISGSGMSGSIHLLMDDFDPSSSQLEDQVCAAVIACHEPKSASANQIKKYVSRYHPDFMVDQKPDRFKKALLRAVSKNLIVQVSGLGANGSFQLTSSFTPSPAILAGEEESEEDDSEEEEEAKPVYIPRGTKSRGLPKPKPKETKNQRAAPAGRGRAVPTERGRAVPAGKGKAAPTGRGKAAAPKVQPKGRGRPGGKRKHADSSEDEASPAAKKGKGRPAKKPKQREPSPLTDEDEEDLVEYTPRKSKSRGGVEDGAGRSDKKAKPSGPKAPSTPTKKQSNKKESPNKKESAKKSPSRKRQYEDSDADDEEESVPEYTPRKSQSRGGDTGDGGRGQRSPKKAGKSPGRKR